MCDTHSAKNNHLLRLESCQHLFDKVSTRTSHSMESCMGLLSIPMHSNNENEKDRPLSKSPVCIVCEFGHVIFHTGLLNCSYFFTLVVAQIMLFFFIVWKTESKLLKAGLTSEQTALNDFIMTGLSSRQRAIPNLVLYDPLSLSLDGCLAFFRTD